MSSKVTSITEVRAAARRRTERAKSNGRTVTFLLVAVAVLIVIGLAATISASSTVGITRRGGDQYYFLKRQLLGVGIGTIGLVIMSRVPYRIYRRVAMPAFLATVVLLVVVLMVGAEEGGGRRWLLVGPFSIQPSEIAKLTVILAFATILERKQKLLGDLGHFLGPLALILVPIGFLVMKQPDLGTAIILGVASLAVIYVSSAPMRFVVGSAGVGGAVAVGLALSDQYRLDRITGFMDPWADAADTGYQLIQSYYALGTGGLTGVGLGASRARWSYLPNAHTDFIFSIIGEESGFIGGILVIGLFAIVAASGWIIASRAPDQFGRMIATGITAWISVQAIVNIGGVLGVMPITGITLPFVSYGSSAVIVTMAALGVLVNIAHEGSTAKR
ncbi:MAG: putative lipid II flippase FtsW [Acidimicrobiia bacterium]|nr:putative lipid II flippase FtsW [Acidimicrobiia bacterium]